MKFCILIALSLAFVATSQAKADLIAKLIAKNLQDGKNNNDWWLYHPKGDFGVMGHHATVFGDQPKEDVQVANMITDMMMKDLSNEENRDSVFGLIHHGIKGVDLHAFGAHHLLGDEDDFNPSNPSDEQ